jgi:hypothetical protein
LAIVDKYGSKKQRFISKTDWSRIKKTLNLRLKSAGWNKEEHNKKSKIHWLLNEIILMELLK